jgi:hypothetical protein
LTQGKTKRCIKCDEIKPITEFYKNNTYKDRLDGKCKVCICSNAREYYKKHTERAKEQSTERRKKNPEKYRAYVKKSKIKTAEKVKEYNARWARNNPEKIRQHNATRYQNHPDVVKENSKKWFREHPDEVRIRNRNRLAKVNNAPGNGWSVKEEKQLIEDYGHRCAYCDKKTDKITMDHIVPITRGGTHSIENIAPACGSCNSSKHNKPLLVWMYQQRMRE